MSNRSVTGCVWYSLNNDRIEQEDSMYILHEYHMAWADMTHYDLFWMDSIPEAPYGICRRITRREAEKLFSRWYADLVRQKQYKPIWA